MLQLGAVPHSGCSKFGLALVLLALGIANLSPAAEAKSPNLDPSYVSHCMRAIETASLRSGVPKDVMLAISLSETGKNISGQISPWPWTVNMEGAGVWFESQHAALDYTKKHFARGARSFDVGCFQINYKWHHKNFNSIEEMFDPLSNALYAARFLTELYLETGSWHRAAGFYHSRTPEYAERYAKRFERHRSNIAGNSNQPVYAGHGSEPLRQASAEKTSRPAPVWPLAQLGYQPPTEIMSSTPSGSLVRLDGGPSLLTSSTQSLF